MKKPIFHLQNPIIESHVQCLNSNERHQIKLIAFFCYFCWALKSNHNKSAFQSRRIECSPFAFADQLYRNVYIRQTDRRKSQSMRLGKFVAATHSDKINNLSEWNVVDREVNDRYVERWIDDKQSTERCLTTTINADYWLREKCNSICTVYIVCVPCILFVRRSHAILTTNKTNKKNYL